MDDTDFGSWNGMASAPRDGSRVLVAVRSSEQGPAEVDVARWANPGRSGEPTWLSADSSPSCVISYSEVELVGWMPLPTPAPERRPKRRQQSRIASPDEIGGSGI